MPSILIIVENLTIPLDRRVWQECKALARSGFTVSVICPKAEAYPKSYEFCDNVHIFRHSLPHEANGIFGYALEYIWAFLAELFLAIKIYRKIGFDVIQACNPPDNIFIIGWIFRILCGTKFVFDHHDPFAALFALKFPKRKFLQQLVEKAEHLSLRTADMVITTSEELRKLAIQNHDVPEQSIHLIRSGIDRKNTPHLTANPALKNGRPYLVLYIGVMGVQDGVDLLLKAIAHMVHDLKRTDVTLALLGDGTELPALKALATELNINNHVVFTGYIIGTPFLEYLSTADVGICPDPKNDFNDKLSMNKVLEYMAFSLPVVQFDLNEGRFIAGDAAAYAVNNDPMSLAQETLKLLDDPDRRAHMGALGKKQVDQNFDWATQEENYIRLYQNLLSSS